MPFGCSIEILFITTLTLTVILHHLMQPYFFAGTVHMSSVVQYLGR